MIIKKNKIETDYLKTICWLDDTIIDWALAGKQYFLDGTTKQLGSYHISFNWDAAITSADGQFAFLYQKLGTKGALLKNGQELREINRPYYFANAYEYPAAFITHSQTTYLVHCPKEYCRLDFENVETGEIITDVAGREPSDTFHSRLEVNQNNSLLMSKGWWWHPLDAVEIFDIDACIKNPLLLDKAKLSPLLGAEICTASFIDESKILVGSSDEMINDDYDGVPEKSIAIWDLSSNKFLNPVKVNGSFGNLYAISEIFAWDVFEYPKIIDIKTGEIVARAKSVNTGKQNSSIVNKPHQLIFNRVTKQLAIKVKEKIVVLTPPKNCT